MAIRGQAALLALVASAWFGGASAVPTCQGTFVATPLHPLPLRIVVDLDIHDRSQRNLMLADRFLQGVREVGVVVGQEATVLLHVTTSRLGDTSSRSGVGAEQSYSELHGLEGGGLQPKLPPIPATGLTAARTHPRPPPQLLVVRVDATEGKAPRIAWVASIQCQMTGTDDGQLAQEIGSVIGAALGQRIDRRAFGGGLRPPARPEAQFG